MSSLNDGFTSYDNIVDIAYFIIYCAPYWIVAHVLRDATE